MSGSYCKKNKIIISISNESKYSSLIREMAVLSHNYKLPACVAYLIIFVCLILMKKTGWCSSLVCFPWCHVCLYPTPTSPFGWSRQHCKEQCGGGDVWLRVEEWLRSSRCGRSGGGQCGQLVPEQVRSSQSPSVWKPVYLNSHLPCDSALIWSTQ